MPVPDAVHVRVRATVCRRNLVGGMLRRALTRAVNMTAAVRGGAHRRRVRGTPRPPAASAAARNAEGSGKQHYAAITDPKEVGPWLRLLDGYAGTLPVRCALRLAPLVFVRPGELIKAEWVGIDLEGAEWRYTVTKTGTPHVVPLARQAVAILREVHSLTGHGRYVFPNAG